MDLGWVEERCRVTQRRRLCDDGGRDWSYALTSCEHLGSPEAERTKVAFSPRVFRECTALLTPSLVTFSF